MKYGNLIKKYKNIIKKNYKNSKKIIKKFIKILKPDQECPGLKPPETDLCIEKPSCSGNDSHVLADSVSLIFIHR